MYDEDDPMMLGGTSHSLAELRRAGVTNLLRSIRDENGSSKLERLCFYQFDGLWTPRVERFEEFLRLCQSENIKVVLVRTPLHPLGWEMLNERPEHQKNLHQLDALIRKWETIYSVVKGTVDASRVEDFDGDPDDFYDEMHCGPVNSQRILSRLANFLKTR